MARTGIAADPSGGHACPYAGLYGTDYSEPLQTGECMTILTGVPVHIKRGDKCVVEVDSCLIPKLGSCILGDDMVLGNSFADGTYQMLVEIGPLSARRMESFFPAPPTVKY